MAYNRITADRDVLQLVRMTSESLELECDRRAFYLTPQLERAWDMWEAAVQTTIRGWARKHVRPEPDKWATRVITKGNAPLNVWLTITGEGAGIWDGRWDAFFQGNEAYLQKLQAHLQRYLSSWIDRLEAALTDAAYECTKVVRLFNGVG